MMTNGTIPAGAEYWNAPFGAVIGYGALDAAADPLGRAVEFFLQGIAEMILVDERPGLERRVMRFLIWGDDLPSASNVGVVIPAGVAHAIRSASSTDLLMVYGTSTTFVPASEGRIASSVESAPLPGPWQDYLDRR